MKIEVLGTGCPSCHRLYETTQKVVTENNISAEVEYVSGERAMEKIIELGALSAPVMTIDGQLVLTGGQADQNKIKEVIGKFTS